MGRPAIKNTGGLELVCGRPTLALSSALVTFAATFYGFGARSAGPLKEHRYVTSHQQRGHTETGSRFKVSSERPEKRGIDLAVPELVV